MGLSADTSLILIINITNTTTDSTALHGPWPSCRRFLNHHHHHHHWLDSTAWALVFLQTAP
jgi:hypothetical protein